MKDTGPPNYRDAILLIQKILENPNSATKYYNMLKKHGTLEDDYHKLSFEYDALLSSYQRLQEDYGELITSLTG
tara:strand:+ start:717 stop:938 length:222 start_codon:yes stop_codon:yes gene_type:complete